MKMNVKNRKFKKMVVVVLACVMLAAAFGGCKRDTEPVVTIEDYSFSPGLYLMYQLRAYELLSTSFMPATFGQIYDEATGDFAPISIQMQWRVAAPYGEGQTVDAWLLERTLEDMYLKVYFDQAMEEYGLVMTDEDITEANAMAENMYSEMEQKYNKYYTRNGIGIESIREWLYSSYKQTQVFNHLYEKGGEREPAEEELVQKFLEAYGYWEMIQIPFYDISTGTPYDEEDINAIETYIKNSVTRINNGEITLSEMQLEILAGQGELSEDDKKLVANVEFVDLETTKHTGNLVETFKALGFGKAGYDKNTNNGFFFVFVKKDSMAEGLEYYDNYRYETLRKLKESDFLTECAEQTQDFELKENIKSIKKYSPWNIKPELSEYISGTY